MRRTQKDRWVETELSPKQAAERLGRSVSTLARWRMQGTGPRWHRVGKQRVVYDVADLDAWRAQQDSGGAGVTHDVSNGCGDCRFLVVGVGTPDRCAAERLREIERPKGRWRPPWRPVWCPLPLLVTVADKAKGKDEEGGAVTLDRTGSD